MATPLQFACRTQKAISVFNAAPAYEPLAGFAKPEGNLRCCVYSPCGRYFAYATNDGVTVVDPSEGGVLTTLPLTMVYELGFSPQGSYLTTWERPAKDEAGDTSKNLKVWYTIEPVVDGDQKQPLGQFVQKSMTGWNLQYTSDEQFCARMVTNEIQFYQSNDLRTVWNKLRVEGVTDFAVAPGSGQNVAVFVPERKGQPAAVKVFNVPHFTSPVSQKTFYKGDKVQLKWNELGTCLLVLAQTEVDKSNKSYYGETNMYLLGANGSFDARVMLDKEGPIHDISWSPNSKEFGVIYGYMPAKTTIFNHRAVATHTFALGPRNTIIFSPNGRFALVAGFGNLAGQIDVYDLEKDYRKVCTIESGNPSVCSWSPDSRYILTATTSPRLRVDNGVKLWHVGGSLMFNEDMIELYNVVWRPVPNGKLPGGDPLSPVPTPHSSAVAYLGNVKTPSKPVGAYRPPGARGATPLLYKREDEGGAAHQVSNGTPSTGHGSFGTNGLGRSRRQIPGAELADSPSMLGLGGLDSDEYLSKTALKNKKKRNNKKSRDGIEGSSHDGGLILTRELGAPGNEGRSPNRHDGYRSHSKARGRSESRMRQPRNGDRTQGATQASNPDQQEVKKEAQQEALQEAPVASQEQPQSEAKQAIQKKVRSLEKKLRAIDELIMRDANGDELEDTQRKKIGTKEKVVADLEKLYEEMSVA